MKRTIIILFNIILVSIQLSSQVPNYFKYQAVVRNSSGEIIENKSISLKLEILQNSETGIVVYGEVHKYITNEYGVVSVNVGSGTVIQGVFGSINWGTSTYYLEVEVDINGGTDYKYMGTSQILSVPYALYALDVKNKDDADADPTNEIQDLQLVNNILKITNNAVATEIPLSQYIGTDTDQQNLSSRSLGQNSFEISIERGTGVIFDDYVSRHNGGIFEGFISSGNIKGNGILTLNQNLTLNGNGAVNFTALGATNLSLPISVSSAILATEDYVRSYLNTNTALPLGNIWVGNASNVATPMVANSIGHILLGNGTSLLSLPLSGDASISGTGLLTLSNVTAGSSAYGNGLVNVDSKGRVISGTNPTTLAGFGILDGLSTNLNSGNIYIGNSSNIATKVPVSGDATLNNSGVLTLSSTSVTPGVYTRVNVDTKGRITFGDNPTTLLEHNILDGLNKSLINRNIFIGNSSNLAQQVTISGDGTLENTGVLTISRIGGDDVNLGGIFNTGGALSFTGSNSVTIASTGPTSIILPTTGTIATTGNTISNSLPIGNIIVGGPGNIATTISVSNSGNIMIGNGSTISSQAVSGDASLASNGSLTVSRIGGDIVNLGGQLNTGGSLNFSGSNAVTIASTGTTSITLPTSGVLATTTNTIPNTLSAGNILIGNVSGFAGQVTISGDASLASNGVLTLTPTTVAGYRISDAMTTSHPANGINNTNISNWNTSFSWGNHASAGYLTSYSENDPLYSSWNKSTGITITASQVSDFQTSVTNNSAMLLNTAKYSYPLADASKLSGIAPGAEVNVNADWNAASGDAQIVNKPTTLSGYGITDAQSFITPGTVSQYWRGDKSWSTLDKSAVGLSNVENTALSAWSGTSNLITLGTVTNGVWHGTLINGAYIDWSAPGQIGSATPNLASFSSVNISNIINLAPQASAPASPLPGDVYIQDDALPANVHIFFYNGAAWVRLD